MSDNDIRIPIETVTKAIRNKPLLKRKGKTASDFNISKRRKFKNYTKNIEDPNSIFISSSEHNFNNDMLQRTGNLSNGNVMFLFVISVKL